MERVLPNGDLKDEINKLIELKSMGAELDYGDRIPVISDFIEKEIARLEAEQNQFKNDPVPVDILDGLFRRALKEVWGDSI